MSVLSEGEARTVARRRRAKKKKETCQAEGLAIFNCFWDLILYKIEF